MDKPIKVLLVASEFPPGPGGIGQHAYYLASQLSKFGDVSVIANADYASSSSVKKFDEKQSFKISRFTRMGILTPLLRLASFLRKLQVENPTTIVFTGLFPLWLIPVSRIFLPSAKRIAIIHGHEPIFSSRFHRWITNHSVLFANSIIPVSSFSKDNLTINSRVHAQKIHIIPNGINEEELKQWPIAASEEGDPQIFTILEGYPILLTVGHTSKRKGQHNVIAALPYIRNSFPDVRYYCVGRDVNNDALYELARKLKVDDILTILPPREQRADLGHYYASADILMLLSENQANGDVEGFGIVALEANFFGTPVIGSRGCGVEDAVDDTVSGILVDPHNQEAISNAVNQILTYKSLYKQNALIHAKKFEWNTLVEKYMKIIQ